MCYSIDKTRAGTAAVRNRLDQKLFRYFQIVIMLYLVFDTGMYIAERIPFQSARTINYIFSMLYFLVVPLPGFIYLLYCDYKVYDDANGLRKRLRYYSIPAAVHALVVFLTPFTNLLFSIDENNIYTRGSYFWVMLLVTFGYVLACYPLLAVKTKNKRALSPKGTDLYLYLVQLPPIVLAIVQLLHYEALLLGMSLVLSAFFIYTSSIQSSEDSRRLSVRFTNINIMQFAVISFILIAGVLWTLEKIISEISQDYAVYNSASTANVLKTYINMEIGILGMAAYSRAVIDWLSDENNPDKKRTAFNELISTLRVLSDNNMYIVAKGSGQEYMIGVESAFDDFKPLSVISAESINDKWVFDLMNSVHRYNLNIDVDKELHRKRLWLNYKVMENEKTIGIISIGTEFSVIAEQLFSQYDNTKTRIFVIDENGVIFMDSSLLGNEDFLLYGIVKTIDQEITSPEFIAAIQAYLESIDGYFDELIYESAVIELNTGRYKYATIAQIGATNLLIVTLFDASSLFSLTKLLPPFVIIMVLFIVFIFNSNRITQRLIFTPLKLLVDSLLRMKENSGHGIYGMERNDEIGLLSNTIQDLFIKGHYDGLTGIYNRRYMEVTLQRIMVTLSRTQSMLSVLFLDIDFFKKYNDTYGHSEGDECLKTIAQTLNKVIMRGGDFAARYGGEEFVVVLPGTDKAGAQFTADKMLQAIRELKIPHVQNDGGIVTVSIGITTGFYTHTQTWADYIKKADEALYISKQNGRNRCTFLALNES